MHDEATRTGWFTIEQVAAIFEFDVAWVATVRDQGLLTSQRDDAGRDWFDPLSVEGLRRQLERVHEKVDGLDPREAERVRHFLAKGARDRMRALATGHSYSTHPTIPPPPAGWMTADRSAYDALVRNLRQRSAAVPIEAPPPPPSGTRHLEMVPPPRDDGDDDEPR